MCAHNRTRWIWLAAAMLMAGVLAIAMAAPLMADPTPGPRLQAAEALLQDDPVVQVAHLAPFAMDPNTVVTITVDGAVALTSVAFAQSTGYLPSTEGSRVIEVLPGAAATPAITATFDLMEDQAYAVLAIGGANGWPLQLRALVDDLTPPDPGNAKVRIGHLAPFATDLISTTADVRLRDGTVILDNVTYGDIDDYIELPAGTYDLLITSPDGGVIYIDPLPVTLLEGDILSLFAVGDGVNQPLGVYALPAGAPGFLLPLAARLQVAHLAPFAMDPGTAVTVTLNGTAVLTNVQFADSTGHIPVPGGTYEIGIIPAGAMDPVITETFVFTPGMDFTVLAIGGANLWDLELRLLMDDPTPPADGQLHVRLGHLAPFAEELGDTAADVRLRDGTVLLDSVTYGTITDGYAELPEAIYDLLITSPGGGALLINPMPVMLEEGQILSIFAVGDGENQPLGVFVLPYGQPGFLLPLAVTTIYMPLIVFNAQP